MFGTSRGDQHSTNNLSLKKILAYVTRRKRPDSDHVHPASQHVGSYFLTGSQRQEPPRQNRKSSSVGTSRGGGTNLRSTDAASAAVERISLTDSGRGVPISRGTNGRDVPRDRPYGLKPGNNVVVVPVEPWEPLPLRGPLTNGPAGRLGAEVSQQRPPAYTPGRDSPSSSGGGNGKATAGVKVAGEGGPDKPLCCDKCDGKHETDNCPYYKKQRDAHPDAQKNGWKKIGGTSSLPGATLRNARVVRQPGDGSCLFHSMSYGLKDGATASTLRSEICSYIEKNPSTPICETPLSDWVKWDSGVSCRDYARRMARGAWGGGIEMACASLLKGVNVHVYERAGGGFKRISAFDHPSRPEHKKTVKVLYCGGVHYDALVGND